MFIEQEALAARSRKLCYEARQVKRDADNLLESTRQNRIPPDIRRFILGEVSSMRRKAAQMLHESKYGC